MDHISKISQQSLTPHSARAPRVFSDDDQHRVAHFYRHLSAIYLAEYERQFNRDARKLIVSKREWAEKICCYTIEQIDRGVEFIKQQKMKGDDCWRFLDIAICVGAIKEANRVREAHKMFERAALPDKSAKERADKVGKSELANMKGMFS